MTLQELAVDHDYYASDSNYYSNDAGCNYKNWSDFSSEFMTADVDLNLCYRWDINKSDDGSYWMKVFLIGQRKGIYIPISIDEVVESDVPDILKYLSKHWEKINRIWNPISLVTPK